MFNIIVAIIAILGLVLATLTYMSDDNDSEELNKLIEQKLKEQMGLIENSKTGKQGNCSFSINMMSRAMNEGE